MIDDISTSLILAPQSEALQKSNSNQKRDIFKLEQGLSSKSSANGELTEEEQAQVDELKKVDQEVRAHEAAHKNVGGQYASNPTYTYTVGPDDNRYAIGGEVQIDTAPIEGDPEATIAKMDVVIAAALAPAKPSAQDRKVAAAAVAARNQARAELAEKKQEEREEQLGIESSFDVNDFGKTPITSVQKAYENGLGLNIQNNNDAGSNFSVSS